MRVPIQRNRREENARIRAGEVPEDWSKAKRAQKDVDASRHKLVRNYRVTPANVHDSQVFDEVIDPDNEDPDVWADSAYRSEATEARLEGATYLSPIHEKGQAGQPLNDEQTQRNQARSRIRARVEHLFGFQENSLGGKRVRTLGLARAKIKIGLMNLAYNLCRYAQLCRRGVNVPATD